MENKIFYVSVKYGEFDFGVSSIIKKLSQTQYDELRAMLVTAIGAMESMRLNSRKVEENCKVGENNE